MNIGLTYDLRADYLAEGYGEEETAEFDRPDTVEAIEAALTELGYQTDRIGHARHLIGRLAQGDRWDLVFNIAEGLHGLAREAQVPAILDVYDIPYTFSDPLVLSLALHKGLTKTILRQAGIPTPDFALVERPADIDAIDLPFPLFAKPVAEGTSKGVSAASKILDRRALRERCEGLLREFCQPVLVETFLSGREFTVGITGSGGEAWQRPWARWKSISCRRPRPRSIPTSNKEQCEELVRYRLARPAEDPLVGRVEEISLRAWARHRGPRRRPGGRPLRRPGRAAFPGVEPPAGPPPAALRLAYPLQLPGDPLRGPDRPDRPLGPAEDGQGIAN